MTAAAAAADAAPSQKEQVKQIKGSAVPGLPKGFSGKTVTRFLQCGVRLKIKINCFNTVNHYHFLKNVSFSELFTLKLKQKL